MTMKNSSFRSKLTTVLLGAGALASSVAPALAGDDYWQRKPPTAPEAGVWIIGAAIVALLGLDLVRRKLTRKGKSPA